MNQTLRLLALASCSLSLAASAGFAKGQPDWTKRDQILGKNSRGAAAVQELGAKAVEVARRNGLTRAELEAALHRDRDLAVDKSGFLHYVCEGLAATCAHDHDSAEALTATGNQAYSAIPNSTDAFKLHSLPGATRVIYLDFTGHTTSGTVWNSSFTGGADIVSAPLSTDSDPAFSTAEKDLIKRIWARIAEEYAPFAVDVTTEDPGVEALRKSGSTDSAYGIRVVISPTSAWYANAGGVAYVGSFSASNDLPCFAFSDRLGPNNEKYIADAVAHEAGHTLGLSHDGKTDGTGYYQGHGNWAPIMGVGYYKSITQWSKGEYALANNKEDDLAIIAANGAPRAVDDNGNSLATATQLVGTSLFMPGVIETSTDSDVFTFDTGAGSITLSVAGSSNQPNADLVLDLVDSNGNLVATANPSTLSASLTQSVAAGTYYVRVKSTAYLDPLSTGYSSYGSLGEYVLQGTLISTGTKTPPSALASVSATSGLAPLSVDFSSAGSSDADGSIVSYSWNFGDGSSSTAASPNKVYSTAGTYNAVLTVVDNDGFATSSDPVVITVNAAANILPVANASASVTNGTAPVAISFSSAGSTDTDGSLVSYSWNFGDGSSSTAANPSKTYSVAGTFTVTLTVTDDRGGQASKSLLITVSAAPKTEFDLGSLALATNVNRSGTAAVGTIRIVDSLGRGVAGVSVKATWSGKVTGSTTLSTDANGYVVFTSKRVKTAGTATLTVNSLSQPANYSYNSALFVEPMSKSIAW